MCRDVGELQLTSIYDIQSATRKLWDESDNTGDARYGGIARALEAISFAWEAAGAFETATVDELNHILRTHLPEILDIADARSATEHARWMRETIYLALP